MTRWGEWYEQPTTWTKRMIEKDFDVSFIAGLALREKQIQQNYRPIIAVHKWFARRPGALFRGLLLAEFGEGPLSRTYYQSTALNGTRVADPFMGGGTPLLEANRTGCDVVGFDINPMAYWIVKEEIGHIDLQSYRLAAQKLRRELERRVGRLYLTRCTICRTNQAKVKYFLWVKVQRCPECHEDVDLFPGYLLSEDARHPRNVYVCSHCGELQESDVRENPGHCQHCAAQIATGGPAKRNRCSCTHCGAQVKYPDPTGGPPRHRMFAIEYFCPACKARHKGRFFKKPDLDDLERAEEAERMLARLNLRFVPEESIPGGDETDRLLRWGYRRFRDMFNSRQLFGLEISCQLIADQPNERVRHALATNLSDLLRYQNMLCRYDTMALKSLDIFSVHGFPVGLVQCESNLLGIPTAGETSIGSGGWSNIIGKYTKAKAYCDEPFEFRHDGRQKTLVKLAGEWIGERRDGLFEEAQRTVDLRCGDSAEAELSPESLDAIFTDPPYFGNVQYAELMDFCYVWLRQFAGDATLHFLEGTTKNDQELTGNASMNRGIEHFTGGLSRVFQKMATALRPGRPLAFTYHHNKLDAYRPIAVAILDSGLACTAALPCPAEMGASIHINGTGSSIVDTVFVCRKPPLPAELLDGEPRTISELVATDRDLLTKGGVKVTAGDERCVGFGHITRAAICSLASSWDPSASIEARLERVKRAITDAEAHAVSRESNAESVEHSEHVAAATPLRTALI